MTFYLFNASSYSVLYRYIKGLPLSHGINEFDFDTVYVNVKSEGA